MTETKPAKYETHTFASATKPETIAAYSWKVRNPIGAVFLLHGFRSHIHYNFLRNDTPKTLHQYGEASTPTDSSMIRELNTNGLSVYGHDHVGHGRSTGLRAYFPAFQTLVTDLLTHVQEADARDSLKSNHVPVFLLAHSLGGTVAVTAALQNPTAFDGLVLSSAATEPPASMFGLVGRVQSALSFITSAIIPQTELLGMPKCEDKELQAMFDSDPLNTPCGIRARVGYEILNAYADIAAKTHSITLPFLTISGELDTLVHPDAAERFHNSAASTDKTLHAAKDRWHNLLVEEGREAIWEMITTWVVERSNP